MTARVLAIAFLSGAAAGSLVTAFLLRSGVAARDTGGDAGHGAPDAELRQRLQAAEEKLRTLEQAPVAGSPDRAADPSRPASPGTGDVASRLAELRSWIPTHRDNRDGKALLRLLHELAALGPAGYASAIEVFELLETPSLYGLDWGDMDAAFRGHDPAFLKWALDDPAHAPVSFRVNCVRELQSASTEDLLPYFADLLRREREGTMAHALALGILYDETVEMVPQIEELARIQAADSSTVGVLMQSLSRAGEPGERALERLAADTDPVLSEEAAVALAGLRTGVKGWLVTETPEGPVRRGDVVVSIDGVPALNSDQVQEMLEKKAPEAGVTLVVRRGDQELRVTVGSGEVPEYGRMVEPAADRK